MAVIARLDENPDDPEARDALDRLEREAKESAERYQAALSEAIDAMILEQLGAEFPGKSGTEIREAFGKKQLEAFKAARFPGKSDEEIQLEILAKWEEMQELQRQAAAEALAFFRIDDLSRFDVETEHAFAAFGLSGIERAVVMGLRSVADRRLTVFVLNLWADALVGKTSGEPLPLNPETGKPIVMEKAEDRVTLRSGVREDDSSPRPWEAVMTIRLR